MASRHHDFYFMEDGSLFASGENDGSKAWFKFNDKGHDFVLK